MVREALAVTSLSLFMFLHSISADYLPFMGVETNWFKTHCNGDIEIEPSRRQFVLTVDKMLKVVSTVDMSQQTVSVTHQLILSNEFLSNILTMILCFELIGRLVLNHCAIFDLLLTI